MNQAIPSWDQVAGIVDRILLSAAMFAVAKGYISKDDAINYVALGLGVLGAVWGWYRNRPTSLAERASNIPGTTVITTDKIATQAPQENVISNMKFSATAK